MLRSTNDSQSPALPTVCKVPVDLVTRGDGGQVPLPLSCETFDDLREVKMLSCLKSSEEGS